KHAAMDTRTGRSCDRWRRQRGDSNRNCQHARAGQVQPRRAAAQFHGAGGDHVSDERVPVGDGLSEAVAAAAGAAAAAGDGCWSRQVNRALAMGKLGTLMLLSLLIVGAIRVLERVET